MKTYLVDYENFKQLDLIKDISHSDEIVIFYTFNARSIELSQIEYLTNKGVAIKCIEASNGTKNALDFQLDVYLGYLIGQGYSDEYIIVSRDQGFQKAIYIGEKLGAKVSQFPLEEDSLYVFDEFDLVG